jgi:hypothetical protein
MQDFLNNYKNEIENVKSADRCDRIKDIHIGH